MLFHLSIGAALILDLIAGDPRWFPHPVRFVGFLCVFFEGQARKLSSMLSERCCGILAFALVLSVSLGSAVSLLYLALSISQSAALFVSIVLLYFSFATGDLVLHSKKVYLALADNDIETARKEVGNLVGRDTADLNETTISRACVESVAENLVDGITAPLFWAYLAGLLATLVSIDPVCAAAFGAVFYKCVNTMDSMFGYKNDTYRYFGWCAASVDDYVNFFPARISGICIVIAALVMGYDYRTAARIFLRDRLESTSPNSGHSEAAFAGALGIRLGGESSYFGETAFKPFIGGELREVGPFDIIRSNRLVVSSTAVFFILITCCYGLITTLL